MPSARAILFVVLGVVGFYFCFVWARELTRRKAWVLPRPFHYFVGFVTDFLDTLGIGSFAVTTALYRPRQIVADEDIPGTLNIGHTLPTIAQALIYISIIEVDMTTLVLLIMASILGAWLGAGIVTRLGRKNIQLGMGIALLAAAALIMARLSNLLPSGGDTTRLEGPLLVAGLVGNFIFGALMTIGVGAYAPIMILVSLLGMNPKTAFPIMMGSCAFLMPIASIRFIRSGAYNVPAALGLALAGIPAVLIAAFIVKELPLDVVRWLVVVVVIYTATAMLRASRSGLEASLSTSKTP